MITKQKLLNIDALSFNKMVEDYQHNLFYPRNLALSEESHALKRQRVLAL